jgi:hypothetical protein
MTPRGIVVRINIILGAADGTAESGSRRAAIDFSADGLVVAEVLCR